MKSEIRNGVMECEVRAYQPGDLESILRIQREARYASSWVAADYQRLVAGRNGLVLVAEIKADVTGGNSHRPGEALKRSHDPSVVGFAAFCRVYYDEAELWNVAVTPEYQRRGLATSLLRRGFELLGRAGVAKIFLEVRASNTTALALYRTLGFSLRTHRKGYYHNPPEDAAILSLDLASVSNL